MQKNENSVEKAEDVKAIPSGWKKFWKMLAKEETAAGVIEVLLILVVLIAIVILFKDQITALAQLIFGDMFEKAESVF